jgi:hypothetical protein
MHNIVLFDIINSITIDFFFIPVFSFSLLLYLSHLLDKCLNFLNFPVKVITK